MPITRLQKQGYRQEVTGLLVNEKVNVQNRYIKQLRLWMYYWERYGYNKAHIYFNQQYSKNQSTINQCNMAMVLSGKLEFLKMIKGSKNESYLKLRGRYDKLLMKMDPSSDILGIWEKEGIEKAMQIFYSL